MTPTFFHGTKFDLRLGDLVAAGHASNFGTRKPASWVCMAGTLEAAVWRAELALGEGKERI